MVYINQVEFENFKSFGGNISIPLEEGFTVVTGPNGSGKSNILDGILFCLGLASSRGMRAERLPDLINTSKVKEGKSSETSVSVRFNIENWSSRDESVDLDLEDEHLLFTKDQKEWVVSRKLRLMPGGSYASTYTSDGKPCNLQQIQKLLRDIRVDPEGSNVVMQGDVTRIVSMSNKERRTLIDELAGVALFDTRIEQTHSKLNDVYERQERCEILLNELQANKLKLEKECEKAKRYKKLKQKCSDFKELKKVILYQDQLKRIDELKENALDLDNKKKQLTLNHESLSKEIEILMNTLQVLVSELKDKGEDKLIRVNSDIGGITSSLRELERLSSINKAEGLKLKDSRDEISISKKNLEREKNQINSFDEASLLKLEQEIKTLSDTHKLSRQKLSQAADKSGELSEKNHQINIEIESLQNVIEPLNAKKRNLEEEMIENNIQRDEISSQIESLSEDKQNISKLETNHQLMINDKKKSLNDLHSQISGLQNEITLLSKTTTRLSEERLRLEKDLSRFESRKEALNETRGSHSLRILLESGLEGIHGYVAQLGEVNEKYRYALEIAAGNRLGQIVVDNDSIAAKAIDILKRKKAGRLTFLPLNRIKQYSRSQAITRVFQNNDIGYVDKAINLIQFDEIYYDVFRYVFGETQVFSDLNAAKSIKLKNRIVTLNGELLESSGAITGGSKLNRDLAYKFGTNNEIDEISPIKQRLLTINDSINKADSELARKNIQLGNLMKDHRKLNEDLVSISKENDLNKSSLDNVAKKILSNSKRLVTLDDQNNILKINLKKIINLFLPQQKKLDDLKESLKKNYQNNKNESVFNINKDFEGVDFELEKLLQQRNNLLEKKNQTELEKERILNEQRLILIKENNLEEAIKNLSKSHHEWILKRDDFQKELVSLEKKKTILEKDLGVLRRKKDELNSKISNKRQASNEVKLKLEYLERDRRSLSEEQRFANIKLGEYHKELPDPLPDLGEYASKDINYFESEILSLNSKLESLEPVNMLALEELEELEERLDALIERLSVLSNERSELLLRIETVSTMRQEAFMEAFSEVDKHFREIFTLLSDGDGFLQLENMNMPLEGGLTLVAHPKGKNVRRLASMSGGEKSLTALSFLFALQKYKPSPFYAFDEVDSFLDGINVERLSKLISSQSNNAQFIVVSHRRPMISASMRTIGVAQARGAHTQVVGLPNAA